jgi:hypothetical protein
MHNSQYAFIRVDSPLGVSVLEGDALGGLVVSVLATEPTGYSVAGLSPTEDGGFLRVIKIHSTHFLRRGSKAVGPMS